MNCIHSSLKDFMTAFIAVAIMLATGYVFFNLYGGRAEAADAAYQRGMQLLQILLGFAGTVVGFYFGRAPAEKQANEAQLRANQAQKDAANAQTEGAKAQDAKARVLKQVEQVARDLGSPPSGGSVLSHAAQAPQVAMRLNEIIRENS